jgi:Tol biopolymer transport system component
MLAAAALAIAGGLASAGSAHAQYFGQNKVQYRVYDWRSIQSDHFEVYFYEGLDSLAMRVLDLAEKTNLQLSTRMGHQLTRRVPIILYGSHNDFAQTNLTPEIIEQNTGGFTEALRNRVVLPFTGSYEDLRHVVVHELVHAFMFDLLYGSSAAALIARQSFFSVPLWFGEGLAEYFSLGMESNAEMFLRDGTIAGYLPPLPYTGGYFVYKQGQSALTFFVDRYGEERLRDLLLKVRQTRNFDRAFLRSTGISVAKFDEHWRHWVRKRYWPAVATKEDPEEFARRLTDHRRDESNLNTAPAISPQGDRIAYFSDRRQYTDVYVMSAFDGKVQHRVIRGERNNQFESIPSFRSSITWSPDGTRLALTAKSAGRDWLYIVSADEGKVLRRLDLGCEALAFPTWSPVSDSIVVTGLQNGRSDLWLVHASTGHVTRLTDDTYDEKEPTWSPDGRRVTFSSDRTTPVVLHPLRRERGFGAYAIYDLEVATGDLTRVLDTWGDDRSPAWSADGRRLAFITDRGGTANIFLYDLDDQNFTQLTDVIGGVSSLTWSRQGDRVVFSSFNRGGYDVFAVKEPLSSEPVVARLRRESPEAVFTLEDALEPAPDSVSAAPVQGALARAWPDSVTEVRREPSEDVAARPTDEPDLDPTLRADSTLIERPMHHEPMAWERGMDRPFPTVVRDTAPPLPTTIPLRDDGGPFALPDSVLAQEPSPYRARLAPDYAGGGFAAATGYGFAGSTQFLFSDFLGNHSLFLASDIFSASLEESNALAIYSYLPRRWDVGVGLFHFKNYFSSRVTTLGEQLGGPRLFSERTFGALASASYPFDRFRRVEFNLTQMFVERTFFEEDAFGRFFETGDEYRSVTSPSVSLVGDHALFGYYGPVNGARWNLTYSPSFALADNGLSYQTVTFDTRRYWDFTRGYTFASRVLAGVSDGRDAQTFRVGGFNTLRGYSDFDLLGSRIAIVNAELRFPFIQQLGLVGPVPLGFFNLKGAVFGDAGLVWNEGDELRGTHLVDGERRLKDPKVGFGTGVRTALWFFILKLDCAWSTSFADVSRPRWHFSIGPEF